MQRSRTRIWLGVGSAILAGGHGVARDDLPLVRPALAQDNAGRMQVAQGGEGGWRGVPTPAQPADPDVAFTTTLLLIRGHLLVGDELVQGRRWSEALPHFLHPAAELYGDVREPLAERDLPPFGDALDLLSRTVRKGGDAATYAKQRDDALETIERVLASVPAAKRGRPDFLVEVSTFVLATAADEYDAAFEGGQIVNVVEYQDSLGFVREVVRLLDANKAAFSGANAERFAEMRRQLDDLSRAWPSVTPPPDPVLRPDELLGLVSEVELSAGGLR